MRGTGGLGWLLGAESAAVLQISAPLHCTLPPRAHPPAGILLQSAQDGGGGGLEGGALRLACDMLGGGEGDEAESCPPGELQAAIQALLEQRVAEAAAMERDGSGGKDEGNTRWQWRQQRLGGGGEEAEGGGSQA